MDVTAAPLSDDPTSNSDPIIISNRETASLQLLERASFAITGRRGSPIYVAYLGDINDTRPWLPQGQTMAVCTKEKTITSPCTLNNLRHGEVYCYGARMGPLVNVDGTLDLASEMQGQRPLGNLVGADFWCRQTCPVRISIYLSKSQELQSEPFLQLVKAARFANKEEEPNNPKAIRIKGLQQVLGKNHRVCFNWMYNVFTDESC